ncbi:type III polyketide synthase [Aneurinibacillus migulanus]|uniref:15-methylpalmitoyl-4-hydroxy-2-pyrone synthase n=1 Tax=Aneurinibacillus migulanus TaxID=47500 RepID=A0A0D1XRG4_ANEMI|nr:3-oxoacyl-[acyl-carrier-protein] synthase III C-terminal domain-containing protein [Aneurinibacillus migulanus]KIV54743.1 chalcone synthase [Aneurinibacillus migulanus]KON96590.1 chalcone synthase [Aneurinibacillus migulanus]MED0895562.1 3-oxoacyl-[acyl-carrier-protein] synthase III C-terminal domain-containing protein [Aneurinibacillus migulanus]MED1617962.1 3-oxoacyl-[acyl-carrier-protein] synthase III C-terminal domain-containing protein [Aneurinibacillus migulanus]SDJ49838.1 15-methylpa
MARITAVGTSVPPHVLKQDEIREFARHLFGDSFRDIDRLLPIFHNGQVETRHFCVPLEWFGEKHMFSEKNDLFQEWATRLGVEAAKDCLEQAGKNVADIDHILFVSTTGISTPSIDSRIMNELGMNPHTKRTPIWGLGCAGGAAGLSRAADYVTAYPGKRVLLIAVECCGLTFQCEDKSKSNLVATSLFADGAAAVLIEGETVVQENRKQIQVIDTMSTLWPDTRDVMGWDINENGLKVIFSRDIPTLVDQLLGPNMAEFLERHGMTGHDIRHFIAHPGGKKVIEAYAEVLGVELFYFSHALDILRRFGNMSSVTVLFVLQAFLKQGITPGEYGIVTALGPGFSSEMLLVKG